jgi:hypothetical protein
MHIAASDQEIHNSITITELDKHTPLQTTMPEQETLENISEIPQENLNAETTQNPKLHILKIHKYQPLNNVMSFPLTI